MIRNIILLSPPESPKMAKMSEITTSSLLPATARPLDNMARHARMSRFCNTHFLSRVRDLPGLQRRGEVETLHSEKSVNPPAGLPEMSLFRMHVHVKMKSCGPPSNSSLNTALLCSP